MNIRGSMTDDIDMRTNDMRTNFHKLSESATVTFKMKMIRRATVAVPTVTVDK